MIGIADGKTIESAHNTTSFKMNYAKPVSKVGIFYHFNTNIIGIDEIRRGAFRKHGYIRRIWT